MKLEFKKNAKRNIIFGLIDRIVSIILPFVIRTVLIYYLGAEYLGLSSLFSSILQVLSISELGFSSAITFCMYKPIAEEDKDSICRLLNFFRRAYFIIGLFIILIGGALTPFLPHLINGEVSADINLYILYGLYLINTAMGYLLFSYRQSILSAYQREDIVSKINMFVQLVGYSLQIIVLIYFRNYYYYYIVVIAITFIRNILLYICSRIMYPDIKCSGELKEDEKKQIVQKIKGLLIGKISGITRNGFDSIFISSFLGLVATAKYSNYFYIMNSIIAILSVITNSIMAGVGNKIVVYSEKDNYNDMMRYDFGYMWIAMWCTCCLLCLYQPFVELAWGRNMLFSDSIMFLFCIYFYSLQNGNIRYVYATARGLWWENRHRDIAEAFANFTLNFILGKYFGVVGILLATIVSNIIIGFIWATTVVYKYYFVNFSMKEYFLQHLKYCVSTIIISITVYFLCSRLLIQNVLIKLIVNAIICCIVPNIMYLILFSKNKYISSYLRFINKIKK